MEIGLYYVCAVAGFLLVVGSLFLIWKGTIYIDAETKQVTEIELPLGIKLKTNLPVLAIFIFGAFLLAFPIRQIKDLPIKGNMGPAYLSGNIDWGEDLDVDVVAGQRSAVRGEVRLEVPRLLNQVTVTYWGRGKTSYIGSEDVPLDGEQKARLKGPQAKLAGGTAGSETISGATRNEQGASAMFNTSGPVRD